MKLTLIGFRGLSLKKTLLRLSQYWSLRQFHEYFNEFCEKIFGKKRIKSWNKSLGSSKNLISTSIGSF